MSYQQPPTGDNQPMYQTPPPYTQYPQTPPPYAPPPYAPPPPRKNRTWLWVVLGIAVFLVLICAGLVALAAIGSRSTTSTSSPITSGNTPAQGETPAPTQAPAGVGKVGSTITVNDVATTLVSVKKLAADQYTPPKPGNEFIVVTVKITNNSTGEVDYNEFDFHVRSGSGNITDADISPLTYKANNLLNSGKLSPGGTVEGDIIFQVGKADHKVQLTWQPNILGNAGDNVWNLGL